MLNKRADRDKTLQKYTLLMSMASSFLAPFMGNAVNLAIPSIASQFNSGAVLVSWVVTSYILASAAFLVPFGRLADIIGRRKVFITGLCLFAFFSLLCGLSGSIQMLIALRVLQGISVSMIFSTGVAILTSVFPPQDRGKVLGMNVAFVYAGLSFGPVLGGMMTHNLGWQSIFFAVAGISLAVIVLALLKVKGEWYGGRGEKFDFPGAVQYTTGLVMFLYGLSLVAESLWGWVVMAAGLAVVANFVRCQMKVDQPVLDVRLFTKSMVFVYSNLAALISYSATMGVGFLMSLHLQLVMGYNSQTAGLIMLSQPIIMTVLSPFAGRLSDRVEPRIVASLGMALTALGLFLLCFISAETSVYMIIADLFIMGTGFALFSSPNTNAVMSSADKRFYGVASSILATMRQIGNAVSMSMVTLIISVYIGNIQLRSEHAALLLKSSRTAFAVFTVLCLAGIFASLARGEVRGKETWGRFS